MTPLDALARARAAWEATQPQLFMDLWPDTGLNEPLRHPVGDGERRLVEPALGREPQARRPRGGLEHGPEPHGSLPPTAGSGPLQTATGPDAPSPTEDAPGPRR